ncbi:hypothetical protein IQ260_20525 [Leptolyngbya cf. ectocarpi LEGE 11479]|uniref:Uncharacterized protein n=1 Tax=Leptolyngbya cf. ectocarpi LEGE 11479 TaxID=1828722 RepID=A0A928ZX01_LEPEC|nr:hypothetical protein [Leptolyngbya ectocarpi]MBE9069034.1 hypothetical protein [Leptolyngbya cf. ectocarpi LEGE 11479]
MSSVAYKKIQDREIDDLTLGERPSLSLEALIGTWHNTNTDSQGIVKVILTTDNGQLTVQAFGAGQSTLHDWQTVVVDDVYASSLSSQAAISYTARYQFDFKQVELQVNQSKGLMIIASHHVFLDGSNRSNYFCREFFQKAP